jgi:hypothetical protein
MSPSRGTRAGTAVLSSRAGMHVTNFTSFTMTNFRIWCAHMTRMTNLVSGCKKRVRNVRLISDVAECLSTQATHHETPGHGDHRHGTNPVCHGVFEWPGPQSLYAVAAACVHSGLISTRPGMGSMQVHGGRMFTAPTPAIVALCLWYGIWYGILAATAPVKSVACGEGVFSTCT